MTHWKSVLKQIITLILVPLLVGAFAVPASAQDESVDESPDAATEPVETEELIEGTSQGVYWWAEPDPAAIAGLVDFGVDTVALRLGRVGHITTTSEDGTRVTVPVWDTGEPAFEFEGLPSVLDYRLVVELGTDIWDEVTPDAIAGWLVENIDQPLINTPITVKNIELKLADDIGVDDFTSVDGLLRELLAARTAETDLPIVLGINPSFLVQTSRASLESIAAMVDGVVVYFMDYDYTGISPRITDRPWIDATSSELQSMGIEFTAVLPVYNRALAYRGGSAGGPMVLPAIDLNALSQVSDVQQMGVAGTEFTIRDEIEVPGTVLAPGDRIRVLESIREISIGELIDSIPETAPNCREIDLFRFPLVPGFDPPAAEVVADAGWVGRISEAAEVDPEEAEREEMDKKYNQTQQIIMIVTLALMMFVMMRMFNKGAGRKDASAGDGK